MGWFFHLSVAGGPAVKVIRELDGPSGFGRIHASAAREP
jgi:hypothetical protein